MKKYIVALLSFTLFFLNVKAEDNYYMNKENKIGEYLTKLSSSNYEYKDYNDILYLEYSDWYNYCNVNKDEYEIDYRYKYMYQDISKIKYINIENLNKDNIINKIEVYNIDKLIDYELLDNNILILNEDINPKDLIIKIDFNNKDNILYNIKLYKDENNLVIEKDNINDNKDIIIDDSFTIYNIYDEIYYLDYKKEDDIFTKYIDKVEECRYRKYLIYNYNINNNKENNYIDNKEEAKFEIKYNEEESNEENYFDIEENNNENENQISNEEIKNEEIIKKDNKLIKDVKPDNKLIKTLKVSDDTSIVKYLILVVIMLTIIYIILYNKEIIKRKK